MALTPARLSADNFTPATRTPWGGSRIPSHYKPALQQRGFDSSRVVGEAWEFSATPEFPSRTEDGQDVRDRIASDREGWLGREAGRGGTAMLLKWIDAADALSLQIHPRDDHPGLAEDEAGKPESWYIVEADEGAGLYLGLVPGVTRNAMAAALEKGDGSAAELLRFVPVAPGDFFVLDPGMPHAIGAGITLVEPQFVSPGRRGVTYRYWDWDRRYDAEGRRDPQGAPRPLHLEQALAVTDFAAATDTAHLSRRMCRAGTPDRHGAVAWRELCGPKDRDGVPDIVSDHLQVARLSGTGRVELPDWNALRVVTVIAGEVTLGGLALQTGETAVIPAAASQLTVETAGAEALVAAAV